MSRVEGKPVSCADGPHCKTWKLHKFRKAFATLHNANRVPVPTIQAWLGHSSIQTTLLYIADAAMDTPETSRLVVTYLDRDLEVLGTLKHLDKTGKTF